MLQLSSQATNRPVLSLRVSSQIATTLGPIINPNNLKIEGWWCKDIYSKKSLVLQSNDVREFVPKGIVINDHDSLTPAEELVRMKELLALNFILIGKKVVTTSKEYLGKVSDYVYDTQNLYIQKMYVAQSILKNFSGGSLTIDRSQIVEIAGQTIVVRDATEKAFNAKTSLGVAVA